MMLSRMKIKSPECGGTAKDFLTAILEWKYPICYYGDNEESPFIPYTDVRLTVSLNGDFSDPEISVILPENVTSYRIAVQPGQKYYWRVVPIMSDMIKRIYGTEQNEFPENTAESWFVSGLPRMECDAPDEVRYRNPRKGARWQYMKPVEFAEVEEFSPWYEMKGYHSAPPPKFDEVRGKFLVPVLDGEDTLIDMYWYCWKTFLDKWVYEPLEDGHQAVSNMIGVTKWWYWGDSCVWDTAFMLYYGRYGHQAYPFITGFDNFYARQHENGFICRENDRENREVYVRYPLNPPLFAWAEWQNYLMTDDAERLRKVFLPLVKHYEWWMVYQRRENGVYWTDGFNEADDSPRNELAYEVISANAYQALAALCLSKIADVIGRSDMKSFFDSQHAELKGIVNDHFWDEEHQIYNDKAKDGRFITELEPGKLCKHCHMFWPLISETATPERAQKMLDELRNPDSFWRITGIPSLSADSHEYDGGPDGSGVYWKGSVWPPIQCYVQAGLLKYGFHDEAAEFAKKYLGALKEIFIKQGDVTEFMAPDRVTGQGVRDFVGWGGVGPIANLIEHELGFDIDVPAKTITWRIRRLNRHGIKNLKFNGFNVDMICSARRFDREHCVIRVESEGSFTLKLVSLDNEITRQIAAGIQEITFW